MFSGPVEENMQCAPAQAKQEEPYWKREQYTESPEPNTQGGGSTRSGNWPSPVTKSLGTRQLQKIDMEKRVQGLGIVNNWLFP